MNGTRRALVIAPLRLRLLVIVSSPGVSHLDEGTIVFDQTKESLSNRSLALTYSTQYFKDKWPAMPHKADFLIIFNRFNELLEVETSDEFVVLNLDKNEPPYKVDPGQGRHVSKGMIPLYTAVGNNTYYLSTNSKPPLNLTTQMMPDVNQDGKWTGGAWKFACSAGQGQIQFLPRCDGGAEYTANWNFTAGFFGQGTLFLFDATSFTVIQFPASALSSGETVNYTSIPFKSFWSKPKPKPTLPPELRNKTTHAQQKVSSSHHAQGHVTQRTGLLACKA